MTPSEISQKLGDRIRQLREERSISQQNLAELCNFEKTNMARIESGRTNPTLHTLHKISSALRITLAELVDFEIKMRDEVLK